MFRRNVFQAGRAHRACPKDDLTRARVERLEELDNAAHRIRHEQRQVHDDLEVLNEQHEHVESRGHREERPLLHTQMLCRRVCRAPSRSTSGRGWEVW